MNVSIICKIMRFLLGLVEKVTGFKGCLVWNKLIQAYFRDSGLDQKEPILGPFIVLLCPFSAMRKVLAIVTFNPCCNKSSVKQ